MLYIPGTKVKVAGWRSVAARTSWLLPLRGFSLEDFSFLMMSSRLCVLCLISLFRVVPCLVSYVPKAFGRWQEPTAT